MANIAENLRKILASRFGKDVRQAIHDSISDINEIAEGQEQLINSHIQDAEAWAKGTKNGEAVESTDPTYHNNSKYYSEQADTDRLTSEAFAKGTHDGTAVESGTEGYHDNAKYYKEQAETAEDNAEHWYQETLALSQTLANAIIARGTVAFADLPVVTSSAIKNGFMYNISDNFTTTSDFVEGAGVNIPMGANVYKVTINNVPMWDILAGSSAAVFVGTEAQIAQADAHGLISENTMIISLDGEAPYELTSSMILHGSDSVENVLDGLSDIDYRKSAMVTPTSSGKSTLLDYIIDVLKPLNISTYSFPTNGFSDLPLSGTGNWTVTVNFESDAINVIVYQHQSGCLYYVRDINSSNQWINAWDRLALESEITRLSKKNIIYRNTLTFASGARQVNLTQLIGHDISTVRSVVLEGNPVANTHAYISFYIVDHTASNFIIMLLLPNATSFSGNVKVEITYDIP